MHKYYKRANYNPIDLFDAYKRGHHKELGLLLSETNALILEKSTIKIVVVADLKNKLSRIDIVNSFDKSTVILDSVIFKYQDITPIDDTLRFIYDCLIDDYPMDEDYLVPEDIYIHTKEIELTFNRKMCGKEDCKNSNIGKTLYTGYENGEANNNYDEINLAGFSKHEIDVIMDSFQNNIDMKIKGSLNLPNESVLELIKLKDKINRIYKYNIHEE